MDQNSAIGVLKDLRMIFEKNGNSIDKMILYGSFANNTQHEGSDIDVVIISKDFKGMDYWQRIKILTNALIKIRKPIEPVAMTPEEWENKKFSAAYYAENGLEI
jgi:predicted nucleotidyltransferase